MRVICVDDERLLMEDTVSLVGELPQVDEVKGFTRARDALDWLSENPVDLALLDIDMPGMNGIELAAQIKTRWPDTAIVFSSRAMTTSSRIMIAPTVQLLLDHSFFRTLWNLFITEHLPRWMHGYADPAALSRCLRADCR